jgi:ribosomal protein S18 acetylase RimI-like enzyme
MQGDDMSPLRPMTEAEFAAWCDAIVPDYAAEKVKSGDWLESEALMRSRESLDTLLPCGIDTPDNHLFAIVGPDGDSVGMLWFAVKERSGSRIAYVYNIAIHPECRRQGHAERAFEALEHEAHRLGLRGVFLHVFGHNHGALSLYEKLGFEATDITMFKPLGEARS